MVEKGAAIPGDVDVRESIVVKIADRDTLAVMAFTAKASFIGDIGEGSIPVVVIERTAEGTRGLVDVGGSRLDEEQVHQTVLVIIEPGHAGAHGFEIVLLVGLGRVLLKRNAGSLTNVGVMNLNTFLDWSLGRLLRAEVGAGCHGHRKKQRGDDLACANSLAGWLRWFPHFLDEMNPVLSWS